MWLRLELSQCQNVTWKLPHLPHRSPHTPGSVSGNSWSWSYTLSTPSTDCSFLQAKLYLLQASPLLMTWQKDSKITKRHLRRSWRRKSTCREYIDCEEIKTFHRLIVQDNCKECYFRDWFQVLHSRSLQMVRLIRLAGAYIRLFCLKVIYNFVLLRR